jgi:hypothetical protein
MSRKSSQGFTVVEVLVGIGILLIAFVSALSVLNLVDRGQKSNEDSLSYASARNKIVSLLLDDTSWSKMIANPGNVDNPNFGCLVKQDSTSASDRDCFGATAPLVMYNIKGQKYSVDGIDAYDFRSATQGISDKGQACNTFTAAPAAGDPNCPYQVVLTWKALCSSSPCVNPPILFSGVTAFNGSPEQLNPNLANLNFQVIKSRLYCPPLTMATTPTTHLPAADVDVAVIGQIRSTLVGNVPTSAFAKTDVAMAPCRRIVVSFSEDIPATFAVEPNNTSEVSILDENSGAKVFQFRRIALGTAFDYQLLYNGAVVAGSKPSWLSINSASTFKFDIMDGLVKFCIDDRCPYYFTQKLDFPFRMSFKPASTTFTPGGFKDITYTLLEL